MAKEKDPKNKRHFFKDFKAELKKVIWPTPKQIVNNTVAVVVIVLVTAMIVFVLDLVFDILNTKGINKLKEKVATENVIEEVITEDGNTTNTAETEAENTVEVTENTAEAANNIVE